MSVNKNEELESVVIDLMGGEDQSPEGDNKDFDGSSEREDAPDQLEPQGDETCSDSAVDDEKAEEAEERTSDEGDSALPAETFSITEKTALEKELANYKKRLHDTQKAMHEANTKRAELQKRLDSINESAEGEEGEDDWFKDTDEKGSEESDLKREISELRKNQEEYQLEQRRLEWLREAEKFKEKHSDFEELVFVRLESLLDEETGDPMIRTLYSQQADRSPAGAYDFAKKLFGYQAALKGESIPAKESSVKEETEKRDLSKGKRGLDRVNSAEFVERRPPPKDLIDEIFG